MKPTYSLFRWISTCKLNKKSAKINAEFNIFYKSNHDAQTEGKCFKTCNSCLIHFSHVAMLKQRRVIATKKWDLQAACSFKTSVCDHRNGQLPKAQIKTHVKDGPVFETCCW